MKSTRLTLVKLDVEKNEVYVQGLIENLTEVLDRWVILRSSPKVSLADHYLLRTSSSSNHYLFRKHKYKIFLTKSSENPNPMN